MPTSAGKYRKERWFSCFARPPVGAWHQIFLSCVLLHPAAHSPPVQRLLACLLTALLLLQTLGRELLVVNYALNKARITAQYCVNKAKPMLHCNGQCHLAQQLRKTEGTDKKAPVTFAKGKFDVLPTAAPLAFCAPRRWPLAAHRYGARPAARYADTPTPGVFHPPLVQLG